MPMMAGVTGALGAMTRRFSRNFRRSCCCSRNCGVVVLGSSPSNARASSADAIHTYTSRSSLRVRTATMFSCCENPTLAMSAIANLRLALGGAGFESENQTSSAPTTMVPEPVSSRLLAQGSSTCEGFSGPYRTLNTWALGGGAASLNGNYHHCVGRICLTPAGMSGCWRDGNPRIRGVCRESPWRKRGQIYLLHAMYVSACKRCIK